MSKLTKKAAAHIKDLDAHAARLGENLRAHEAQIVNISGQLAEVATQRAAWLEALGDETLAKESPADGK